MDNLNDKAVAQAIQMAIFTGIDVTISVRDNPERMTRASIVDFEGQAIVFELVDQFEFESVENVGATVTFAFRKKALTFETTISKKVEASILNCKGISHYRLVDLRKSYRLPLKDTNLDLRIHGQIEGDDPRNLNSNLIFDFNNEAVSFFVKRDAGVLLPGDLIRQLTLTVDNNKIFSVTGIVQRIDTNAHGNALKDDYLAVVKFTQEGKEKSKYPADADSRTINRESFIGIDGAYVKIQHPLMPATSITGQLVDISSCGIGFIVDSHPFPVTIDMVFPVITIHLPNTNVHRCAMQIKRLSYAPGSLAHSVFVGGVLTNTPLDFLRDLNSYVSSNKKAGISEATDLDHTALWEFFFATGFIYPEKRKQLQVQGKQIFDTYKKLLNSPKDLVKKIVFKNGGEIKGHISAIRFYDHTWTVQHLNALKDESSSSVAQDVLEAMIRFFGDSEVNKRQGTKYVMFSYRPNSPYPATLYGAIEEIVNNKESCVTSEYDFCLPVIGSEVVSDIDLSRYECTASDLRELEDLLIKQQRFREMKIESLSVDKFEHLKITRSFHDMGLYRERKVFKTSQNGETIFAVCNYSSPGINLSELTNSFKVYFKGKNISPSSEALEVILQVAYKSYIQREFLNPVLLLERHVVRPQSFKVIKQYKFFNCNIVYVDDFKRAALEVFGNFKKYFRRKLWQEKNDEFNLKEILEESFR